MSNLPKMTKIKQTFPRPLISDVQTVVRDELDALAIRPCIKPGQKIGITVGSRGIQNIQTILRTVTAYVREAGGEPFLLAAMGSHGGGTAEGQKEVLDSLGLTETEIGAQVLTCAESSQIGATSENIPVYVLQTGLAMDGILVVNRVKTHTSFKGKVESGLIKKLVVGLGGPTGAKQFHNFGSQELPRLLVEIGEVLLEKLPVLGGLAIIENAYEETALIRGVKTKNFVDAEAELLTYSKSLMPALPVHELDLLIIGETGKNFSGTGIDTNIIGRIKIAGVPEPASPFIKRIAILDLSEESHGNAHGIGLADFVTQKLIDKMDRKKSYLNSLTSTFVTRSMIPMYFATEEELVEAALLSLGGVPPEELKMIIIPNTLFLTEMWVSPSVLEQLSNKPEIQVEESRAWSFTSDHKIGFSFH